MALNTFSAGVNTSFSSELNENFTASGKILNLYTAGTSLNLTRTSAGTSTGSYELPAIAAADLGSADYLHITIMAHTATKSGGTSDYGAVYLQIQTKEGGGAYADTMAEELIADSYNNSAASTYESTNTISWTHTLTAGEKANGVQVKLLSKVVTTGSSSGIITHKQTVVRAGV